MTKLTQEEVDIEHTILWNVRKKMVKHAKKYKKPHALLNINKIILIDKSYPQFTVEIMPQRGPKDLLTYKAVIGAGGHLNIVVDDYGSGRTYNWEGDDHNGVRINIANPDYEDEAIEWLDSVSEQYIVLNRTFRQKLSDWFIG